MDKKTLKLLEMLLAHLLKGRAIEPDSKYELLIREAIEREKARNRIPL